MITFSKSENLVLGGVGLVGDGELVHLDAVALGQVGQSVHRGFG